MNDDTKVIEGKTMDGKIRQIAVRHDEREVLLEVTDLGKLTARYRFTPNLAKALADVLEDTADECERRND